MRATVEDHFITEEEYCELEEKSPVKHEYYQGRVYAMAGASPQHCLIAFNVVTAVGSRLRGRPCRGASSDQRVKIEATGLKTYPDTLIVCPPERYDERDPYSLLNPRVIIEVLSPTTERYDRTDKFDQYKQIPSLTDYILIAQDRVRVEHYHCGTEDLWTVRSYNQREQSLTLPDIGIDLPLEEIYDRLNLPAGLFLLPEDDGDGHKSSVD
ncbi:MAG: Uma2 family endonuclease [Armatimonadota bacterium]|nr:Uma2 family endonuclease [Armatimonadota bacterium]